MARVDDLGVRGLTTEALSEDTACNIDIALNEDVGIFLSGSWRHGRRIICNTPNAADLIALLAESPNFVATETEKETLSRVARAIASRYSGYPKI